MPIKRLRGFNLIEAAIVLGVVGLVIGGIWIAASTVQENKRWADMQTGWLYYADLISKSFPVALHTGVTTDLEPWLEAQPLPPGWVGRRSDPGNPATFHPRDPYGNALYAQLRIFGATPVFSMGYDWQTLPRDLCAKLGLLMYTKLDKMTPLHTHSFPASCSPDGTWNFGDFYDNCCSSTGAVAAIIKTPAK